MTKHILTIFLLCLSPAILWADNHVDSQTIHVGLIDSHPWAFHNDNGYPVGIFPDLLKSIRQIVPDDILIELQIMPLKRIIKEMKSSKSPLNLTFMSYKPKRAKKMTPVVELYRTPFVVVSRKNNPITKVSDIKNKDIAMLLGGSGCPCLDESIPYHRVTLNHHSLGLKMLSRERVDAVAGPSIRLYGLAEQLNVSHILAPYLVYEWRTVWMWKPSMDKGTERIMPAIQDALQQLIDTGELARLSAQYLHSSQVQFIHTVDN